MTTISSVPKDHELPRSAAPFRAVRFAPVGIDLTTRPDGSIIVSNRQPLGDLPVAQLSDYLRRHAEQRPEQSFLAEPEVPGSHQWRRISYAQARRQTDSLSQWLINLGLPQDRPIMVLSDNSIHHALLQLAAMQVGIAVLPVSAAYSLLSRTCERIGDLVQRFQPSLVYADDPLAYGNALRLVRSLSDAVLVADTPEQGLIDAILPEQFATRLTEQLNRRYAAVGPDDTARLLLTSGSTGSPKAVVMTQRNILSSGVLWDQVWPFLADEPPRVVDWLPWSHTAGAHGAFGMALRHGGTLYIDDGKPVPELINRTLARLAAIRPNLMVNVPRGLDMLVAGIEAEPALAKPIFEHMQIIVYGGAALSTSTLYKLESLSAGATGFRIPVSASLGSTETTMPATLIWWPPQVAGTVGLPVPGLEAKLLPDGDRFEIRFRGSNITPGYYLDEAANQKAFDEEGFLVTGDAVAWADPAQPELGLVYAGRLAENFKLNTGTWVQVANVRSNLLEHLQGCCVSDVVLAAPNREELGALLFIDFVRARKEWPACARLADDELVRCEPLIGAIEVAIRRYNQRFPRSSTRIARALLLNTPPNSAAGEITDKGHVNQRAVLAGRAVDVERLYCMAGSADNALVFTAAGSSSK